MSDSSNHLINLFIFSCNIIGEFDSRATRSFANTSRGGDSIWVNKYFDEAETRQQIPLWHIHEYDTFHREDEV